MAGKNQVTLTFAGDAASLNKSLEQASKATKGLGGDFDKFGKEAKQLGKTFDDVGDDAKRFGKTLDAAGEAADKSESTFMGTADILDGLGSAFGLPTDAATGMMRAFGDLSGGFAMVKSGLASAGTAFSTFGKTLIAPPAGTILLVGTLLVGAFIAAYQTSEKFRDTVNAAFEKVKAVVGPIVEFIGGAVSGLAGIFGLSKDKSTEHLDELSSEFGSTMDEIRERAEQNRQETQEWTNQIGGLLKSMNNPLQQFQVDHDLTLRKVRDNMLENRRQTELWLADIKTLVDRGFADIAEEFLKLGPAAADAVDQASKRSKPELEKLRKEFLDYGVVTGSDYVGALEKEVRGRADALRGVGKFMADVTAEGFAGALGRDRQAPSHVTVGGGSLGPLRLPGRAAGGPVAAGQAYMVGERGPEVFVPNRNGGIVANGGGTRNLTANFYGPIIGSDEASLARYLSDLLARQAARAAI